ncbi:MAG: Ig-like domain-containing protein [Gaiellaceae bacterium]
MSVATTALLLLVGAADAAPANDSFAAAQLLSGATGTVAGSTVGATKETGEPVADPNSSGSTIWFSWTATFSGPASFDTRGSDFDTYVAVYTGTRVDRLTFVAGNDIDFFVGSARAQFTAVSGTTYRVQVDGMRGVSGSVILTWNRPRPSNDDFGNAQALSGASGSVTGSNLLATAEAGEPGDYGQGHSIWYRWTAPTSGQFEFDATGTEFDPYVVVYTGSAFGSLSRVAVNPSASEPRLRLAATAGTTYRLELDSAGFQQTGATKLAWRSLAAPPNDAFAAAQRLDWRPGIVAGNVWGATAEPGEPAHAGHAARYSVWYRWRAPATLDEVDLAVDDNGFHCDTAVYTGDTFTALTPVASAGDYFECDLSFSATIGTDYAIAVNGDTDSGGPFALRVRYSGPPNDAFADAEKVYGGTETGHNALATKEPGEPEHGARPGGSSIWYRWGGLTPGTVMVDSVGSTFDTLLAAYTGATLGALTQVARDDDSAGGGASRISFHVDGSSPYSVALDGVAGAVGDVKTTWSFTPDPPANDAFASAQRISLEEGFVSGRTSSATKEAGEPDHAGNAGGHSVWYRWVAPADGLAVLDTFDVEADGWPGDTDFDTLLAVYRGSSLASLEPVAANDDGWDLLGASRVSFPVVAGEEFAIAVDGFDGASGRFALNWTIAPPNDDFNRPAVLTGGQGTTLGTTFRSTWEDDPSDRHDPADVWYLWRATQSGLVAFTMEATSYYSGFSVWTGSTLTSLEGVATADIRNGRFLTRKWQAVAGTVYRLEVVGDSFGAFTLAWGPTTIPPPPVTPRPPNDDFAAAAVLIGDSGSVTGTNEGATLEDDEPIHNDEFWTSSTVWYRWTAPFTGTLELDPTGSDFTTIVSVFGGDRLEHLRRVTSRFGSVVTRVGVTAGTTYAIAVGGASSYDSNGTIQLAWRRSTSAPANDGFAAAATLAGPSGSIDLSNTEASAELDEPYHAGARPNASVWYSWTAPSSGPVSFSTSLASVDGRLAVYTGSAIGSLSTVAANDESLSGGTEARVVFTAAQGATYRIVFDTPAWTPWGAASLSWRMPPSPPNDAFANAATLPRAQYSVMRFLVDGADNYGATTEAGEPVHAGVAGAAATVWYRVDWDYLSMPLTLDTIGSTFDTVVAVYTGTTLATLTPVASDDDSAGGGLSRLSFTTPYGLGSPTTYWIAVAGKGGATGKLSLTLGPAEGPPNDHFHAATWLTGPSGSVTGSLRKASFQLGEPPVTPYAGDGSIWYRWTAPATGTWRFDITGSPYLSAFGVFAGTRIDDLLMLGGTDDPVLHVPVVAGQTYSIALVGDTSSSVAAKLAWRQANVDANDQFASARVLSGASGTVTQSNREASVEPLEPFHADSDGGASLWYRWTAPFTGTVAVDTVGSAPADNVLAVYTGSSLLDVVEVASSDDFAGDVVPSVRFEASAGTTYWVAVDAVATWPDPFAGRGDVKLNWLLAVPPANDSFVGAQTLAGESGSVSGTTVGARTEPGEPPHGERAAGASVWYAWTAPAGATYRFDTTGSGFPALLGVYTGGALDTLHVVRRSDDLGGRSASVTFAATAGTTYRIAVDGLVRATGTVSLSWTKAPPLNDAFAAAEAISGRMGTVLGSTRGATREAGEPAHAGRGDGASIWFRWRAPATEPVRFDTVGSDFDGALAVYTGSSVGALTPIAASDDAVIFEARMGVVYSIAIDAAIGNTGNAVLNWMPAPLPQNDDLADAQAIGGREGQVTATSFPATHEPGEPDHAGAGARRSVWYRYRAPATGRLTVRTDYNEFDTAVAAYTGTAPGTLTLRAQDAGTDGTYDSYRRSRISFDVVAGAEYVIAVDGIGGQAGGFTLLWRLPPANDDLAGAQTIAGASGSVSGTTEGSGVETGEPEAGYVQDHTVWYRWTAPADGTYLFDLAGSVVDDAGLEIFAGTTFATLRAGGHWRDPGRIGVVGGTTYLIRVASTWNSAPFRLNWRPVDAPANDNLDAARTITGDRGATSGVSVGSSREPGEPAHGEQGYTVWFRWTAPAAGKLWVSSSGTIPSSAVVAYTGAAVGSLTKVDGYYSATCGANASCYAHIGVPVVAGTTYFLALDSAAEGSYYLNWLFDGSSPSSGTSNDMFASAHVLTRPSDNVFGSNVGATKEPGEPNHAGRAGGKSVWYSWRAPASGKTVFQTNGCSLDTLLAVYTGSSVSALTTVASNDDVSATCAASLVSFTAVVGTTYRIAVDGDGGVAGDFTLQWTGQPADVDVPVTTISGGPFGTVSTRDASFPFYASETGVTFACSLDGAAFTSCTSPAAYTGLSAGSHVFRVRAADAAGNVEQPAAERAWTIAPPPANDAFASRATISGLTGEVIGTVTGATVEPGEPNHADLANDRSVWFAWTAPRDGLATVETEPSPVWAEKRVGVYTGSTVGALTPVGRVAAPFGVDVSADSLTFRATAGVAYVIAVAGTANGDFRLDWQLAPPNDDRRDALVLTGGSGTWRGDNIAATREASEPAHAGRPGGRSIWFRWTAPANGVLQLDTVGSDTALDTLLAVYTEGPPSFWWQEPLFPRAGDDDSAGGGKSRVSLRVFTGTTYWIAVDGFDGSSGVVTLNRSFDAVVAPTPPTVALTSPADGAFVRDDVALAATASDPDGIERVEFLVNGSVVGFDTTPPYAVDWDSTSVVDGPATITARATDFSTAAALSAARTVTVDNTPPVTTILGGPSGQVTSTSAVFTFSADDPTATFSCAIDGLWQPCSSPRTYDGLAIGTHTFEVLATDRAGNGEINHPWRQWQVVVSDTTPPETMIDSGPSGTTQATSATFTFSSNEVGATFECRLDGSEYASCSSPRSYASLAAGAHSFSVRARDTSGNLDATPAERTWTVSPPPVAPPDTTLDAHPPATTTATSATFAFSSGAAARFECSLDGGAFAPCGSPTTYDSLAVAPHSFAVRAVDFSGNPDPTPATWSWTITGPADTTPPDTTIEAGPSGTVDMTSATFTFSANEAGSRFECSLDASKFAACTPPKTYDGLAGGTHTFAVRAADASGNVDATPATRNWTVSASVPPVPPDTSLDSHPPATTTATSATFAFSSGAGGARFECLLDGGAFAPCTSPKTYGSLVFGPHSFAVRAVGSSGNPDSTPATWAWTITVVADTAPPDTTFDSGPSGTVGSTSATFTFSASEPAATFECALDAAAFAPCSSPKTYDGLTEGTHTLAVRASDASGNVDATPAARTWTVSLPRPVAPPDTTLDAHPPATTTATNATFAFSSPAAARFECSLDGAVFVACASPMTYEPLLLGPHTFAARAVGISGSPDPTPASWSWTIAAAADTTPPDTTIDAGPSGIVESTSATFTFSASEAGAAFECSLDASAFAPCSSPKSYDGLGAGTHTVAVRASDVSGNVDASPASRTWTVAPSPGPPPTVPAPAPDLATTLTANQTEAKVGTVISVTAVVSNRAASATGVVVTLTFSPNVRVISSSADRGPGCAAGPPLVCTVGAVATPTTISIELSVVAAGPVVVNAAARSAANDANVADNDATLTIRAAASASASPLTPAPAVTVRTGTSGRDVLRGTARRDTLRGLGGNDVLYGLGGNDLLVGGAGRDRFSGGAGNDVLRADDRQRDVVACGPGRDVVYADRFDRIARDCERVVRHRIH